MERLLSDAGFLLAGQEEIVTGLDGDRVEGLAFAHEVKNTGFKGFQQGRI
ncbi:AMP-forming long-chain acyl-CoA synthetase [Moorella thermoacetica Y72]|uniref:AMP-forming long-chain acyl-CoA synthetase n=1 Tax=Moorella thermoacetica Y72 TaxID=1325331 RepID=A0A0S6UC29_NEOTH|nr:AMP-forming long-chain acyl-CoA synthetase [Moorella thermoacetica Y72]